MAGWEEILFENRNKKYGAFVLRKKSLKYKALGLLFSIVLIFFISAGLFVIFNSDLFFTEKIPANINIEAIQMTDLQDFKFPEPPAKSQEAANPDLNKIDIVDTTFEEKKKTVTPKTTASNADTITKKGVETPDDGLGSNLKGDTVYYRVDKLAEFVGGEPERIKFLVKNLTETARRTKTRMRIIAQLTITKTGDVKDIVIVAGGNPEINNEIVRVIASFPKWIPAQQGGRPVTCRFNLPINL
jgi:protein TonB